jgi:hypothetical protein
MSVPGVPQIHVRPKVTNQTIQFNWQPPASDGGSAITGYTLDSPEDVLSPYSIASTAREYTVTDLSNSVPYSYTITATNAIGEGPAATFRTVQPGLRPPVVPSATAVLTNSTTATVTWTPTSVSGEVPPLLGYSIRTKLTGSQPPYTNHGAYPFATSIDISGIDLSNNTYSFVVAAVNDPGYSVAFETNEIGNVIGIQYTFINPSATYPYVGSAFTSIAASSNGQKVVACADASGSSIWTTTNAGLTWVQRTSAGARAWVSVASDASGTKLIAAVKGGSLWTSGDSGVTWTERSAAGPSPQPWSRVTISANGTYALAAAATLGVASGYIYWSNDSGATWTQTAAPQRNDWSSIAVSNDGATLYATGQTAITGPIYKSTDSGTTWNLLPFTGITVGFYAIAGSSDGTKLVIGDISGGTGIWRSTDSGLNWTNNASYFQGETIRNAGSIASSNSGTRLAVVADNSVWTSGDSGATWTEETTPTGTNLYIACDMSGTRLYAVGDGNGTTGMYIWKGLYTSSWAWTQTLISADLSGDVVSNFSCIACSKNGQYIYLAIVNLPVWKSSDYGATWADISGSPIINGIDGTYGGNLGDSGLTCSDDGSTVVVFQGTIHVSSDYGATWNASSDATNARSGVVRSTKIVVGGDDGIIVSTDGGTTWNNLTNNDIAIRGGLTMSTNGLIIAGTGGLSVSVSTDGGANSYTDAVGGGWTDIRVSADLTKLVVNNGFTYLSVDSGVSWKLLTGPGFAANNSFTVSADFTKIALSISNGIYYSTDSGENWEGAIGTDNRGWTSITSDSTGQYLFATTDGGSIWFSRDYGERWYFYENPGAGPWVGAAVSADGSVMVAGKEERPYISNNGGTDWRAIINIFNSGSIDNFYTVISADNNFIALTITGPSTYIQTSSDSGYTWVSQVGSGYRVWAGMAGSSNGSILYAQAFDGEIYKSTNYGVTWTTTPVGIKYWNGIACDSTGVYVAAVDGAASAGSVWTSADSGATWTERTTGPGQQFWRSIASDSTGQYLVAAGGLGQYIWRSSNYGASWIQCEPPGVRNWRRVSCSADGSKILAAGGDTSLWASFDFGVTWSQQTATASGDWYGVGSSSSGNTILAGRDSGNEIVIGTLT